MATKPNVTDVKDSSHVNRLILEITGLNELGEQEGGPTTDLVAVEGIIGSPEGRSLGSPGDIRVRQDAPGIYQKITGERTTTGWQRNDATECTTIFEVGPGCEHATINEAYTAAKNAGHNFANQAIVLVAPQAGGYVEDITLDRSGIHIIGATGAARDLGSRQIPGAESLALPRLVGTITVSLVLENDLTDTRMIWCGVDIQPTAGNSAIVFAGLTEQFFDFQNCCATVPAGAPCMSWTNPSALNLVLFTAAKLRGLGPEAVVDTAAGSDGAFLIFGSEIDAVDRTQRCLDLDGDVLVSVRDSSSCLRGTILQGGTTRVFFRGGADLDAGDATTPCVTLGGGTRFEIEEMRLNSAVAAPTNHFEGTGTVERGRILEGPSLLLPIRYAAGIIRLNTIMVDGADTEFYSPAVPANWSPVPDDVAEALDQLIASTTASPTGYVHGGKIRGGAVPGNQVTLGTAGQDSLCRDVGDTFDLAWSGVLTADINDAGPGGLQTGSAEAASTWYEIHIIGDTTAVNATDILLIPVGTAFSEVGYDVNRRIGYVRNSSGSDFLLFSTTGLGSLRAYLWDEPIQNTRILLGGVAVAFAAISAAAFVPPTSERLKFRCDFDNAAAVDDARFRPTGSTTTDNAALYAVQPGIITSADFFAALDMACDSSQSIDYALQSAGVIDISIVGFWDEI